MRRSGGGAGRRRSGDALRRLRRMVRRQFSASSGAVPARPARNRQPGRLRDPSWGYYGPCARCSLTAPVHRGDSQARTGAGRTPKGIRQSRCGAPQGAASGDGRIARSMDAPSGAPRPSLCPEIERTEMRRGPRAVSAGGGALAMRRSREMKCAASSALDRSPPPCGEGLGAQWRESEGWRTSPHPASPRPSPSRGGEQECAAPP